MNKRKIKRRYDALMRDVKTKDFYKIDPTKRVNCYVCKECGHITKTKDVDPGVTSFMYPCEKCKGTATSTFYNDIAPHIKPTIEWYRPSLDELIQKYENEPAVLEHIFKGGLDTREIKE